MAYYLADGVDVTAGVTADDLLDKIIDTALLEGWTVAHDNGIRGDERTVSLKGVGDADIDPYANFKVKSNGGVNNIVIRCSSDWVSGGGFDAQPNMSSGWRDESTGFYYGTVFTLGDVEFPFFVQATENSICFGADTGLTAVFAYVGFTDRDPYEVTHPSEFPFSAVVFASATDSTQNDKTATGCATLTSESDEDGGIACTAYGYILGDWLNVYLPKTDEKSNPVEDNQIYSEILMDRGGFLSVGHMRNQGCFLSDDLGNVKLDRIWLSQNNNPQIHFLKHVHLVSGFQMPRFGVMKSIDNTRSFIVMQPTNSTDLSRFYCVELI